MNIGDVVVRKSYNRDITFKIININEDDSGNVYVLKGINLRIIADAPIEDLEVLKDRKNEREMQLNKRVNSSIRKIMLSRDDIKKIEVRKDFRAVKNEEAEMYFGRPGKILHVDGDPDYLETCLKVYKQLSLEAVGRVIEEKEQPKQILDLVIENRPDIVVITGHDAIVKGATDFMNINNYKNSKYYVDSVSVLRSYKSNYDDLIIYAGACQSCYEALLDAGANFASSPARILIHCLDPVFLCERLAYSNIDKVVSIMEATENTITGIKGIGGLQTRGKYRQGYPKSNFI
ncbi:MAG TPA: sporulation peptidase YabG [Clostridiaceae bacterium]